MKNIKKLFVVALIFVLSLCMGNTVLAETTTNKGSIIISGTTKEKIYEVYKIFDLTYSGSEEEQNLKVAYTIDSAWTNFFGQGQDGEEYIVSENTGSLNAITVKTEEGYETKYINITEDNVEEFAQDALAYLGKTTTIKRAAFKKATGETTTIDGLELGYYLVYPEGATEIKKDYASIASLTSTTPTAEINIKATYPTINKTVEENSVEVGEYATFTITGKVPDTTGFTSYTYKIHDSWTDGLTYDKNGFNMVVTIGDNSFTITDENLTVSNEGFTLSIDVKNTNYEIGDEITVVYNLKVNALAINSTTTKNSAYLEYSNNPKNTETSKTTKIEVPVYSSRIKVLKVDGASCSGEGDERTCSIPLAGAKFVLKNEEGKYYSITGSYLLLESNEPLEEAKWGVNDIAWVTNIEDATVFTTNEEGIISYTEEGVWLSPNGITTTAFEGLKDGTYYLVETVAPEGFNKLVNEIEIVVEGTENNTIPVVQEVTVENNSGTALPSTGGFGTKMFILVGSVLAILSAVVLVTNKRMSKEYL